MKLTNKIFERRTTVNPTVGLFTVLMGLSGASVGPVIAFVNAALLEMLGENYRRYGKYRIFGSFGLCAGALSYQYLFSFGRSDASTTVTLVAPGVKSGKLFPNRKKKRPTGRRADVGGGDSEGGKMWSCFFGGGLEWVG